MRMNYRLTKMTVSYSNNSGSRSNSHIARLSARTAHHSDSTTALATSVHVLRKAIRIKTKYLGCTNLCLNLPNVSKCIYLQFSAENHREPCKRQLLMRFRSPRSTWYVDAACCYRPSSVVCLTVCLSVCPHVTLGGLLLSV